MFLQNLFFPVPYISAVLVRGPVKLLILFYTMWLLSPQSPKVMEDIFFKPLLWYSLVFSIGPWADNVSYLGWSQRSFLWAHHLPSNLCLWPLQKDCNSFNSCAISTGKTRQCRWEGVISQIRWKLSLPELLKQKKRKKEEERKESTENILFSLGEGYIQLWKIFFKD